MKMTKQTWFLAGIFALGAVSGVYQLATANRRAHQEQIEQATHRADARIAKDQAAQERRWAAADQPAKPKRPDPVDAAYALCAKLRQAGASTCTPHFNVWSSSYIDATVPMQMPAAQWFCQAAAGMVATPERPLAGLQLKVFSPLGSERPMAVCDL